MPVAPNETPDRAAARARLSISSFVRDQGGGIAAASCILIPLAVLIGIMSVDAATAMKRKARLQEIADSAAIAAANELKLADRDVSKIATVVQNFVTAASPAETPGASTAPVVTTQVDLAALTVKVSLRQVAASLVSKYLAPPITVVDVTSTARVMGQVPICVVGLDTNSNFTVLMDKSARMTATGCGVYSNSGKPNGLMAKNSAVLTAALICAVGRPGGGPGNFAPQPKTCPPLPDPLATRTAPSYSGCSQTGTTISSGSVTLMPGVYCGGLKILGGAQVTLMPGDYIIKDGPLQVGGGARLTGDYVGFFLSGSASNIDFQADSHIALGAPKTGQLVGLLFFEDRTAPPSARHSIASNDAPKLLGTIYLPVGTLYVGANNPVAQASAYTIIVASKITMDQGPNLVINTNYGATDVPVPSGLGPTGGSVVLSQ